MYTDAEVYQACVEIFSAGLVMLSVVWGVRALYSMLISGRHES